MPHVIRTSLSSYEHSEEYTEMVGHYPKGLSVWVIATISLIMAIVLMLGFMVEYRDVVEAKMIIVPQDVPKAVTFIIGGKLAKLIAKEGDAVKPGQVIAYLESIGDPSEVASLSNALKTLAFWISRNHWDSIQNFREDRFRQLGELQQSYQTFVQSLIENRAFLHDGFYTQKKILLAQMINSNIDLNERYREQLKVHEEDYQLALDEFKIKEQLYLEKVVPILELKQERSKLINKKLPIEGDRTALITNQVSSTGRKEELLSLEQEAEEKKMAFIMSLYTLSNEVDKWKRQFIIEAPMLGTVTFPNFLKENQQVEPGQTLCYVLPKTKGYYGEMQLPQENLGKVDTGQMVLIRLKSHEYQEFGMLNGHIANISKMPNKENVYAARVSLDFPLVTNYGRHISILNAAEANAEVVTQRTRLVNRFLNSILKFKDRPKGKIADK